METRWSGIEKSYFHFEELTSGFGPVSDELLWLPPDRANLQLPMHSASELVKDLDGPSTKVRICFQTPLNIRENRRILQKISFRSFAMNLLRRLSSLLEFHCDTILDLDFKELKEKAEGIKTISTDLQSTESFRWSKRQKQKIHLDGVSGEIIWEGKDLPLFWPLLQVGTLIHLGKNAVIGFGKYSLEAL